jgi:chromosome segregation ATPase
MAQRANKFARRQAAAEHESAEKTPLRADDAGDDEPLEISLDLAPLVAPYKRRGRLSLRVERIPFQGRLSKGRNNGDRSWSLAPDELNDVFYLPPKGVTGPHTLAVRIVSLDGGDGATLALLDYPVLSAKHSSSADARDQAKSDNAELRRLREELAELQASLDLSEAELAEARLEAEQLRLQEGFNDKKLTEARAAWDIELKERLAEASARAASELENCRRRWAAEQTSGQAPTEAQIEQRLATERARWRGEAQASLAAAEGKWKTEEAARRAALDADWQKRLEQARAEAAAARSDESELRRLRDELATFKIALVARESELAEAHSAHEAARARWRQESDAAAVEIEARCKAGAERELSAVQAIWREKAAQDVAHSEEQLKRSETALAETRAERDDLRAQLTSLHAKSAEAGGLRGELTAAQAALLVRDDELAQAKSALEQRERELANARWVSEEANRRVEAHKGFDAELRAVREQLAAAQSALAAREMELLDERSAAQQARRRIQQDIEAALAKAKTVWKTDEAARIEAAEAKGREGSAQALSDLTARVQVSETALAEARNQIQSMRRQGDDIELRHLKEQVAALQVALGNREREVEDLRFAYDRAHERLGTLGAVVIDRPREDWRAEEAEAMEQARRAQKTRKLVRDLAVASGVAAALMLVFVWVQPMFSEQIMPQIAPLTAEIEPWLQKVGLPVGTAQQMPVQAASRPPAELARSVVAVHAANVRSGPSKANPVLATLPRDRDVMVLERRGNWVLARFDGADGKSLQGWVFSSVLKEAPSAGSNAASGASSPLPAKAVASKAAPRAH